VHEAAAAACGERSLDEQDIPRLKEDELRALTDEERVLG
jgi:hypothetical protein